MANALTQLPELFVKSVTTVGIGTRPAGRESAMAALGEIPDSGLKGIAQLIAKNPKGPTHG